MNRVMTALGRDPLNPTTLFNPFRGHYYGHWGDGVKRKVAAAFRWNVWWQFAQNLHYEFVLRPRWRAGALHAIKDV